MAERRRGDGAVREHALTARIRGEGPRSGRTYGLAVTVLNAEVTGVGIGHFGDIPGYHTQALYFPERKTTIVAIVDSDASPNDISLAALDVLAPK